MFDLRSEKDDGHLSPLAAAPSGMLLVSTFITTMVSGCATPSRIVVTVVRWEIFLAPYAFLAGVLEGMRQAG